MEKLVNIFLIIAFLSLSACDKKEPAVKDKPVVKIGVTLPLSGNVAFAGEAAQRAVEMALRDIKQERDLKYDYQLIIENDMMEPKQAFINLNRFKSIDKVNAVMSMWLITPVIGDYTEKNQIIHLGCSWGATVAKGRYNFNHCTFIEEQTNLLINEFQRRGIKKAGLIVNNTQVSEEVRDYLKAAFADKGIALSFDAAVNPEEKDFRMEIAKMKEKDAEIVIVLLLSPGMELFAQQAKELGYAVPMTTFNNFAYSPQYFEGQWFVADSIGTNAFQERFFKENGTAPNSCSPNLYDGLQLIVKGFEATSAPQGKLPENKDVAETISSFKQFKGAAGKVYQDKEGNIHALPQLKIVKDGVVVSLGE